MFCSILTCPEQYFHHIDAVLALLGAIIVFGIGSKLYDYIQRNR